MTRAVFLFVVAVILHGVRTQTAAQCSNADSRTIDLSLTSRKDRTGRWVAQVDMEHDADGNENSAWKVDIQHSTMGCPGSSKVKLAVTLTAPPTKPGPGYELYRGLGYYKLHSDKKTWPVAKAICESEGGHLAIINSEAESEVLKNMIARIPENVSVWAFVGFHDMYTEGQYLTIFGEPLKSTGFTRWSGGQPDNYKGNDTYPGEDCGSIHRSNGGLNDLPCAATVPFFCEIELA